DTSRDILVPLVEECLKILPVLFLLWRWRRGRAWTLGAMDVFLMAAASGAGFAVVESAFIRHRFGWPGSLAGLPGTEVFANRLNLGHGIWAALAGATIGLALFIRWRRLLALALGASGLVLAALDHMANNLTAGGKAFGKALDAVMAHGHGLLLLFFALVLASLAIDVYIAYVKRPRLAELEPPTLGSAPASLAETWRFHLDRRELLYAGFRRRLAPVPDQAPPEAVIWSLITSLVDRHFSRPQETVRTS
ncbi:MAG TPA: PrsW family glutamic-type intramembrane protease, partial [Actinomycetota bacterium]|nr:PrsW family glutamic-type intramembrane protease [Actinomycetota bacterium]